MFTGLIEEVAAISAISETKLTIRNPFTDDVAVGDSIAVNGSCLTATSVAKDKLTFDLLPETFLGTVLSRIGVGDIVNLERSLAASGRFDGHMVTGHVDGIAQISKITKRDKTYLVEIKYPSEFRKYLAKKGSVALNGVSLTIQDLVSDKFTVAIIPFTFEHTSLVKIKAGEMINFEVDVVARYVENMLQAKQTSNVSKEFLAQHGFMG